MLDDSAQAIACLVCGLGLLVFTMVMGVAAGRRHQAERKAELQRSGRS
jgi:hypothetical protein